MDVSRESLKEARIHGITSFPMAAYDNYSLYPQYSNHILDTHWHDEMEFLYAERGPMHIYLNEVEYTIDTGDGVVIAPNTIHGAESINGKPFYFRAIVFNLSLLDNDPACSCHQHYFKHIRDKRSRLCPIIRKNETWTEPVIENLKRIYRLFCEKPPGFELGIKSALFAVFFYFFTEQKIEKTDYNGSQHEIERFKNVFEYIREDFAQKITIDDLAAKSFMSKYHFIRMFKRITGRTPLDYINHYRMQQAAKMLEADKLKIVDIALDVGINDCSYFTKLFYKHFGVNPSQYRVE